MLECLLTLHRKLASSLIGCLVRTLFMCVLQPCKLRAPLPVHAFFGAVCFRVVGARASPLLTIHASYKSLEQLHRTRCLRRRQCGAVAALLRSSMRACFAFVFAYACGAGFARVLAGSQGCVMSIVRSSSVLRRSAPKAAFGQAGSACFGVVPLFTTAFRRILRFRCRLRSLFEDR